MGKLLITAVVFTFALAIAFGGYYLHYKLKIQTCMEEHSPAAIEACTYLLSHYDEPGKKAVFLANRGLIHDKAGSKAEALADLKAVHELQRAGRANLARAEMLAIYERMAALGAGLGDTAAAMDYGDMAVSLGSINPHLELFLAEAKIKAGRYAEGMNHLTGAQALGILEISESAQARFYYANGRACLGTGDYDQAIKYLSQAEPLMARSFDRGELEITLGRAFFKARRHEEAKLRLQSGLRHGGACPDCPSMLAKIK